MFVLRVSSKEMSDLEYILDYYLSAYPKTVNLLVLREKLFSAEFYDDDYFDIVLKDSVLDNDVSI